MLLSVGSLEVWLIVLWATLDCDPLVTSEVSFEREYVDGSSRIQFGEDANHGEFPWYATVHNVQGSICGGSIIDEYHILTAAHCSLKSKPDSLWSVVGEFWRDSEDDMQIKHNVKTVYIHPNFNRTTFSNDIAILRLTTPIKFREGDCLETPIWPIKLSTETVDQYVPLNVTVAGFGLNQFGLFPNQLQKLEMSTVPCWDTPDSNAICIISDDNKIPCRGDSGGLLVTYDQDRKPSLVGIVSRAREVDQDFCIKGVVFTRVSYHSNWIKQVVNET